MDREPARAGAAGMMPTWVLSHSCLMKQGKLPAGASSNLGPLDCNKRGGHACASSRSRQQSRRAGHGWWWPVVQRPRVRVRDWSSDGEPEPAAYFGTFDPSHPPTFQHLPTSISASPLFLSTSSPQHHVAFCVDWSAQPRSTPAIFHFLSFDRISLPQLSVVAFVVVVVSRTIHPALTRSLTN